NRKHTRMNFTVDERVYGVLGRYLDISAARDTPRSDSTPAGKCRAIVYDLREPTSVELGDVKETIVRRCIWEADEICEVPSVVHNDGSTLFARMRNGVDEECRSFEL